MSKSFNIPDEIHVGFQERTDTYKDRLAFVTYKDTLGQLKSEKSWNNWRDNTIDPLITVNEPREGFILNRNGGGSWGHFDRAEFVRVYDPLGFEIEITIDNLMKIILHNGISKGNGIEGKLVYAWEQGKRKLSLLPETCEEYSNYLKSKVDTSNAVPYKKGDLKEGFKYLFKNGKCLTYLGKHTLNVETYYNTSGHLFTNGTKYCVLTTIASITHTIGEDENYNTLIQHYSESILCLGVRGTYSFEEEVDIINDIVNNCNGFMKIDNKIYYYYYWSSYIFDKEKNIFVKISDQAQEKLKRKLKGKSGVKIKAYFTFTNGVVEDMIYGPNDPGSTYISELLTDLKKI
jgi:hypothetical protein